MLDEMVKKMEKIKDERDKTLEYTKQMKQVEEKMDYECKKIIAEMENVLKASRKGDKEKNFTMLEDELHEAEMLKKDAYNLSSAKKIKEADIENIKGKVKEFKEKRSKQWDEYYMKIACLAALRSKDPRTPVS